MTTGAKFSRKKEIIALFVVPLIMTIFVAGVIILPGLFTSPKYDFLYEHCESYCYGSTYKVTNGVLGRLEVDDNYRFSREESTLYRYDIETGQSKQVAVDEFESATLDSAIIAPDGFKLQRGGSSGGGFFFPFLLFGGDFSEYRKWYLVKDSIQKEATLNGSGNEIKFVSWIIND